MSCADQRTCAQCDVGYCLADYGICERKETLGALSAPVEGSVLNARQIVFFTFFGCISLTPLRCASYADGVGCTTCPPGVCMITYPTHGYSDCYLNYNCECCQNG